MKRIMNLKSIGFLLIGLAIFTQSCIKDVTTVTETFTGNQPVYMSYEELRSSDDFLAPQEFENPGKIFYLNNYILVNDVQKGVHVIDNSDPSNPEKVGFINVPGNIDIAFMNNHLYLDSYIDMVVIPVSDITNVSAYKRVKNVLPYFIPQYDFNYRLAPIDTALGVVTDFTIETVTVTCKSTDENCNFSSVNFANAVNIETFALTSDASAGGINLGNTRNIAVAGSMARFITYGDYLYAIVDNFTIKVFEFNADQSVATTSDINLGRVIETLFIQNDNLFVGSNTGMFIYSLSNPAAPSFVSEFTHANGCDPVFVDSTYAYVTIRTGNNCWGNQNQLLVVDISNLTSPNLVASYNMVNPHGLAVDGYYDVLVLCDGAAGVKTFSTANVQQISSNYLDGVGSYTAYDVVLIGGNAIVVTNDGIYQYNYTSNPGKLVLLSSITL